MAAIVLRLAASLYDLDIMDKNIENTNDNLILFVV